MNKTERREFCKEYKRVFLKKALFMYFFSLVGVALILIGLLASSGWKTFPIVAVISIGVFLIVMIPVRIFFVLRKDYKTKK